MPNSKKYKIRLYSTISAILLIIHYLLELPIPNEWSYYVPLAQRFSLALTLITIILLIGEIIDKIIESKTEIIGVRYNLLRISRLLSAIMIIIVIASFLFQNLYAVAVSFGLISLILGFALQAPITSFIAWLYIIFRRPYHVGNRIQIDNFKGDVIEISYLDTIMEEFSGDYLHNDRKSGRIIYFPNSLILKYKVINYSGQFKPFIWNETAIQISYTSDLKFVENCLTEAAITDFKDKHTNIPHQTYPPTVYFRVNTYAWLEAVISYPVEPTDTTDRRNRILKYALPLLNSQPDKVGFPEGTRR